MREALLDLLSVFQLLLDAINLLGKKLVVVFSAVGIFKHSLFNLQQQRNKNNLLKRFILNKVHQLKSSQKTNMF